MTVIGALSSFRKPGEMSPHKRACIVLRVTLRFGFVRAVFSADRKLRVNTATSQDTLGSTIS